MARRVARLVALPAGLMLLCSSQIAPPSWIRPRQEIQAVKTVSRPKPATAKKPARRPVPKIVAIDRRIARRVNALRPGVKVRLLKAASRLPRKVTLLITSASRTAAEQRSLRSTFGVKARPGTSTHEDGRAIDVNVLVDGQRVSPRMNNKIIGKAMASSGFRYLGAIDPVHYSVPKWHLTDDAERGPSIEPMTWEELRVLEAQNELDALTERNPTVSAQAETLPNPMP
jgi:hypothetical protein